MTESVLSVVDVTGIQNYIFGSNRLREQIGASFLVKQATDNWVKDACKNAGAVLICSGGGNAVFQSEARQQALNVITALSERLLKEAPGLEIAAAHQAYDHGNDTIGGSHGIYHQLFRDLAIRKRARIPSNPSGGLAVTLECNSTGAPAVGFARSFDPTDPEDGRIVSAEVGAKLGVFRAANEQVRDLLKHSGAEVYQLSNDFDNLGRSTGDQSYIAVVHADANGMGQRFQRLVEQFTAPSENDACLAAIKALSEAVEQAGQTALKNTVTRMLTALTSPNAHPLLEPFADLEYLPFRPLVYGGDDTTFVCDGRLGLPLAAIYLEEFAIAAKSLPDGAGPAFASAGVAIVKVHYPFARAYALCEELCKSAKQALKGKKKAEDRKGSALDWHIAQSGLAGSLAEIRQREYTVADGNLSLRPIMVGSEQLIPSWRSWKHLTNAVHTLRDGADWCKRRNKLIGLREVLREGGEKVAIYRKAFNLPELPGNSTDLREKGWAEGRCGVFDAIEALDLLLPLEKDM
ncbi:MAG: hypothetical protein Fur005_42490 [Roseiflexaceae bacterium]